MESNEFSCSPLGVTEVSENTLLKKSKSLVSGNCLKAYWAWQNLLISKCYLFPSNLLINQRSTNNLSHLTNCYSSALSPTSDSNLEKSRIWVWRLYEVVKFWVGDEWTVPFQTAGGNSISECFCIWKTMLRVTVIKAGFPLTGDIEEMVLTQGKSWMNKLRHTIWFVLEH